MAFLLASLPTLFLYILKNTVSIFQNITLIHIFFLSSHWIYFQLHSVQETFTPGCNADTLEYWQCNYDNPRNTCMQYDTVTECDATMATFILQQCWILSPTDICFRLNSQISSAFTANSISSLRNQCKPDRAAAADAASVMWICRDIRWRWMWGGRYCEQPSWRCVLIYVFMTVGWWWRWKGWDSKQKDERMNRQKGRYHYPTLLVVTNYVVTTGM